MNKENLILLDKTVFAPGQRLIDLGNGIILPVGIGPTPKPTPPEPPKPPEPAYDLKVVELGPDVSAADRPETSDIDFTLYGMNLLNMGFFEIKDTSTISWPSWATDSSYWSDEVVKAWTSNPEDIQHSTLLVINMEWGCNFFSEYLGASSLLGVYIPGIKIDLDTQYNLTVEAMGLGAIGQSTIKFGK